MNAQRLDARWTAGLVAAVIFLLGVAAGVVVDRTLGSAATAEAAPPPATVADLASALNLDAAQRARLGGVLDSLQGDIARAASQGPDSLRAATQRARGRIVQALPAGRAGEFERWLSSHHAQMRRMMRRMGPGMMGPGSGGSPGGRRGTGAGEGPAGRGPMGPGMMAPGSTGAAPMGPGMMAPGSTGAAPTGREMMRRGGPPGSRMGPD